jgi:hypothetical protein
VRIDQHAAQAFHTKPLDETHAPHVRRQVVNLHRPFANPFAVCFDAQVQVQALHPRHPLVPFWQRLFICSPDPPEPLLAKMPGQRPPDEAPGTTDHNQIVLVRFRIFLNQSLVFCNHNLLSFRGALNGERQTPARSFLLAAASIRHLKMPTRQPASEPKRGVAFSGRGTACPARTSGFCELDAALSRPFEPNSLLYTLRCGE